MNKSSVFSDKCNSVSAELADTYDFVSVQFLISTSRVMALFTFICVALELNCYVYACVGSVNGVDNQFRALKHAHKETKQERRKTKANHEHDPTPHLALEARFERQFCRGRRRQRVVVEHDAVLVHALGLLVVAHEQDERDTQAHERNAKDYGTDHACQHAYTARCGRSVFGY